MSEKKNKKEVLIEGRKSGDKITTVRKIIESRRRTDDFTMPGSDEEWDQYFDEHQYGFGADIKPTHGMDLATDLKPLGPWFERLP